MQNLAYSGTQNREEAVVITPPCFVRLYLSHFICQGSQISIPSPDVQCDQNSSERLNNLPKVTELFVVEAGFEPKQTDSYALTQDKLIDSLKEMGAPKCQSPRLFNLFHNNFIAKFLAIFILPKNEWNQGWCSSICTDDFMNNHGSPSIIFICCRMMG